MILLIIVTFYIPLQHARLHTAHSTQCTLPQRISFAPHISVYISGTFRSHYVRLSIPGPSASAHALCITNFYELCYYTATHFLVLYPALNRTVSWGLELGNIMVHSVTHAPTFFSSYLAWKLRVLTEVRLGAYVLHY